MFRHASFDWAEAVVAGLRGTNEVMEKEFDAAVGDGAEPSAVGDSRHGAGGRDVDEDGPTGLVVPLSEMTDREFDSQFASLAALKGKPFPWQRALFEQFLRNWFPASCAIPTGLGKTSVVAIWLLALARKIADGDTTFPRRLVYVVNRRTVVDQATREVERMREALDTEVKLRHVTASLSDLSILLQGVPLAVSTLRGQFADNAEWRLDPCRPAVIVGTVDMIGSRLLFAGYGCGFKSKPLHAGFLGQDALVVHDEAHLEPAFQALLMTVEREQRRCKDFRPIRVMELTATSRSDAEPFSISEEDRRHEVARKRIFAPKLVSFHKVDDERQLAEKVAHLALMHRKSGQAILVFVRTLDVLERLAKTLGSEKLPVQILTGTLRGLERDALVKEDPIFARFSPDSVAGPREGTVYLLCTSAGEVGVNMSADHLVCDLTPLDSMIQRFGRVNRFGEGSAHIDVVHAFGGEVLQAASTVPEADSEADEEQAAEPSGGTGAGKGAYDLARQRTLALLLQLDGDASPGALEALPLQDRLAAFTPAPVLLPTTDILCDAWALTTFRHDLPGRPPVADWLHGVAEWEPPETRIAWRIEVGVVRGDLVAAHAPSDILEEYPLKPHELLRDKTTRVFQHLEVIAARCPNLPTWMVRPHGEVETHDLRTLTTKNRQGKAAVDLGDCTVVLPPEAGGLSRGLLAGDAVFDSARGGEYDVADARVDEAGGVYRRRVWDDEPPPEGMRLALTIDTRPYADDTDDEMEAEPRRRYWNWYVRTGAADDEGSRTAGKAQDLEDHLKETERCAVAIAGGLQLGEPEATALKIAARCHDLGKARAVWQRSIGNARYPEVTFAKSGAQSRLLDLGGYRHEVGSLIEAMRDATLRQAPKAVQDLALHLVAAHHGRARPHFPLGEEYDPDHPDEEAAALCREAMARFSDLQRKYGRWGLAYLESLLRAADAMASQRRDLPGSGNGGSS